MRLAVLAPMPHSHSNSNLTEKTVSIGYKRRDKLSSLLFAAHFYSMKSLLHIDVYDGGGRRGAAKFVRDEEVGLPA